MTVQYSEFMGQLGCFSQSYVVKGTHPVERAHMGCKYHPEKLGTVPTLFKLMRHNLQVPWDEVTVEFDETFGYPKKFYVGSKDLEDAYFQFEISAFNILPNDRGERKREQ